MENDTMNRPLSGGFSLRKIPSKIGEMEPEKLTDGDIDKIKILELSTAIDKWEQEVLFADKGFYSLKGKEVQNKEKEYLTELKNFINREANKMSFINETSKDTVEQIKKDKMSVVQNLMELYSREQLDEWQTQTYENALDVTIQRAVLYKNNPDVIKKAFYNGLKVLQVINEKEDWSKTPYGYRKKQFVSDFYLALINAYINDKDVRAYQYFNQFKDEIKTDEKEKLENQVNDMRINITAYNWAKEVFSYKLDEKDYEKELKNIKDEEIRISANKFYSDFKKSDKRKKLQEEKEKNIQNWKEVMEFVQKDIDKADLYIDYSFKKESIKRKKEYIKQIRETGSVKTDVKEFLNLFSKVFQDFQNFKESDISDYRGCLSSNDFEIFEKLQNYSAKDFLQTDFDLKYVLKKIQEADIKSDEEKTDFIRMYFISIDEYTLKKKESADLEARQKIIESIFARFNKKKG